MQLNVVSTFLGEVLHVSIKMAIKEIAGRVKEWRVTVGIALAVSTVSSFVPV
jgi:hypothetical protein